ncbi:hypothetical protein CBL_11282 [Carabus blaptoides fortunei]
MTVVTYRVGDERERENKRERSFQVIGQGGHWPHPSNVLTCRGQNLQAAALCSLRFTRYGTCCRITCNDPERLYDHIRINIISAGPNKPSSNYRSRNKDPLLVTCDPMQAGSKVTRLLQQLGSTIAHREIMLQFTKKFTKR